MTPHSSSSPTGSVAAADWLDEREALSPSTVSAYRGETNRFCEFLAAHGALRVIDFTEQLWDEYLRGLMSAREAVESRRREVLRQSSALQAARITRSFLSHCNRRGWLRWEPNPMPRRCPPTEVRAAAQFPTALSRIVLRPDPTEDEEKARRRCAISLMFWTCLKPRELASLSNDSLVILPDGTGLLHVVGRKAPAECPPELIAIVLAYRQARQIARHAARANTPVPRAPLLTRLRSSEAISAHLAWQLVKTWQQEDEGKVSKLGAKAVRDGYVALAKADAIYALDQIALQTGHTSESTTTGELSPSAIRIDRVRQRLTELVPSHS